METIKYNQKNIPLLDSADVVVIGGGTTGTIAAISALHEKKSVIIIEKYNQLGGSSTSALVSPNMATFVAEGPICKQLNHDYLKYNSEARFTQNEHSLFFNSTDYATFLDEKIRELQGRIYYDTVFIDTILENNAISYVIVFSFNKLYAIKGKVFVDTSAEATVASRANVPVAYGDRNGNHQSVSLRFEMGNVDKIKLAEYLRSINYVGFGIPEDPNNIELVFASGDNTLKNVFLKGVADGYLTLADTRYLQALNIPGKKNSFSFNGPQLPNDRDLCRPQNYSYFVSEGRQMIKRLANFLKKFIPGFENSYISCIANMLGIRESARIIGEYILNEDDYLKRAKFSDGIIKGDWYIDVHHDDEKYDGDDVQARYQRYEYYEIPYRCLISKNCDNLIVGGRIISTTFLVQASVRIQPTLKDMGEIIGKICSYSIDNNIDLNKIDGSIFKTK